MSSSLECKAEQLSNLHKEMSRKKRLFLEHSCTWTILYSLTVQASFCAQFIICTCTGCHNPKI